MVSLWRSRFGVCGTNAYKPATHNSRLSRSADSIFDSRSSPAAVNNNDKNLRFLSRDCSSTISGPRLPSERRTQVLSDKCIETLRAFLLLLWFFLIASSASSQSTLSSLRGVITDPTGAVVANAQISITNEATAVPSMTLGRRWTVRPPSRSWSRLGWTSQGPR